MNRTRQEMFDAAWNGLKAQSYEQSATAEGFCRYRGPDGLKCAVGHLISDAEYDPRWEGKFASSITEFVRASQLDRAFLNGLQHCHDAAGDPIDMQDRLRSFADAQGLTIPGEPS